MMVIQPITNIIDLESRESREFLRSHLCSLRGTGWGVGPSHLKVLVSEPTGASGMRVCMGISRWWWPCCLLWPLLSRSAIPRCYSNQNNRGTISQIKFPLIKFPLMRTAEAETTLTLLNIVNVLHWEKQQNPIMAPLNETSQGRRPWSSRCRSSPLHVQHQRTTELFLFGVNGNNTMIWSGYSLFSALMFSLTSVCCYTETSGTFMILPLIAKSTATVKSASLQLWSSLLIDKNVGAE